MTKPIQEYMTMGDMIGTSPVYIIRDGQKLLAQSGMLQTGKVYNATFNKDGTCTLELYKRKKRARKGQSHGR